MTGSARKAGFSWSRIGQDAERDWVNRSSMQVSSTSMSRVSLDYSQNGGLVNRRSMPEISKTWTGSERKSLRAEDASRPKSATFNTASLRLQPPDPRWRPFVEAREFSRSLNLADGDAWNKWASQTDLLPKDVPANPEQAYSWQFISMDDWLGRNMEANQPKRNGQASGTQQWMMKGRDDRRLEELVDSSGPRFRVHPHALKLDELSLGQQGLFCGYCYKSFAARQRRYGCVQGCNFRLCQNCIDKRCEALEPDQFEDEAADVIAPTENYISNNTPAVIQSQYTAPPMLQIQDHKATSPSVAFMISPSVAPSEHDAVAAWDHDVARSLSSSLASLSPDVVRHRSANLDHDPPVLPAQRPPPPVPARPEDARADDKGDDDMEDLATGGEGREGGEVSGEDDSCCVDPFVIVQSEAKRRDGKPQGDAVRHVQPEVRQRGEAGTQTLDEDVKDETDTEWDVVAPASAELRALTDPEWAKGILNAMEDAQRKREQHSSNKTPVHDHNQEARAQPDPSAHNKTAPKPPGQTEQTSTHTHSNTQVVVVGPENDDEEDVDVVKQRQRMVEQAFLAMQRAEEEEQALKEVQDMLAAKKPSHNRASASSASMSLGAAAKRIDVVARPYSVGDVGARALSVTDDAPRVGTSGTSMGGDNARAAHVSKEGGGKEGRGIDDVLHKADSRAKTEVVKQHVAGEEPRAQASRPMDSMFDTWINKPDTPTIIKQQEVSAPKPHSPAHTEASGGAADLAVPAVESPNQSAGTRRSTENKPASDHPSSPINQTSKSTPNTPTADVPFLPPPPPRQPVSPDGPSSPPRATSPSPTTLSAPIVVITSSPTTASPHAVSPSKRKDDCPDVPFLPPPPTLSKDRSMTPEPTKAADVPFLPPPPASLVPNGQGDLDAKDGVHPKESSSQDDVPKQDDASEGTLPNDKKDVGKHDDADKGTPPKDEKGVPKQEGAPPKEGSNKESVRSETAPKAAAAPKLLTSKPSFMTILASKAKATPVAVSKTGEVLTSQRKNELAQAVQFVRREVKVGKYTRGGKGKPHIRTLVVREGNWLEWGNGRSYKIIGVSKGPGGLVSSHFGIESTDPVHLRVQLKGKGEVVLKAANEHEARLWYDGISEMLSESEIK